MITENEDDGVDEVVTEHRPVAAASVSTTEAWVVERERPEESAVFTFVTLVGAAACMVGLIGLALLGVGVE